MIVIEAACLAKSFGAVTALNGLYSTAPRGTVCALLGALTAPGRPRRCGSWRRSPARMPGAPWSPL